MFPTEAQIRLAAYARWELRGCAHGHDRSDWLATEQFLWFELNYRVIAGTCTPPHQNDRLVREHPATRRVCRFCEQAEPRTRFGEPASIAPFMADAPLVHDLCEDCRESFDETVDPSLGELIEALEDGQPLKRITVSTYKGLVKFALLLLPRSMLEACQDALEWVSNPLNEWEDASLGVPAPVLHCGERFFQKPWIGLAHKTDRSFPGPSLLAFVAGGRFTIQVPVPLCSLDQDLDGTPMLLPLLERLDPGACSLHPIRSQSLAILNPDRSKRRSPQFVG